MHWLVVEWLLYRNPVYRARGAPRRWMEWSILVRLENPRTRRRFVLGMDRDARAGELAKLVLDDEVTAALLPFFGGLAGGWVVGPTPKEGDGELDLRDSLSSQAEFRHWRRRRVIVSQGMQADDQDDLASKLFDISDWLDRRFLRPRDSIDYAAWKALAETVPCPMHHGATYACGASVGEECFNCMNRKAVLKTVPGCERGYHASRLALARGHIRADELPLSFVFEHRAIVEKLYP